MPIIWNKDVERKERPPGMLRWERVGKKHGAANLAMGELEFVPGGHLAPHTHPNEEAMLITDGSLEAILGDETYTLNAGDTLLAPADVRHGFVNRSSKSARMVWVHPVAEIVMEWVD